MFFNLTGLACICFVVSSICNADGMREAAVCVWLQKTRKSIKLSKNIYLERFAGKSTRTRNETYSGSWHAYKMPIEITNGITKWTGEIVYVVRSVLQNSYVRFYIFFFLFWTHTPFMNITMPTPSTPITGNKTEKTLSGGCAFLLFS